MLDAKDKWAKGAGSHGRYSKREYATRVNVALMGEPVNGYYQCPIARQNGEPVLFTLWEGEVDRALSGANGGEYEPGNVVLVSTLGNQTRSKLQSDGGDMPNAIGYQIAVRNASQGLFPLGPTAAKDWWQRINQTRPVIDIGYREQ